jgi:hypothetical protein
MAGFFASKFWPVRYFASKYFGGGEQPEGAMSATLSGAGSLSASLTATAEAAPARRRARSLSNLPLPARPRRRFSY